MMQFISLYRKYRPKTFAEVIGQEHVVNALQAAIQEKKIGHAYLFSGGRGIGKTSIARIFARELGVSEKDIYEIDAASHRKIEDVHAIRENVAVMPFESPYKVFILDEVHMLSREAFNALLKTLEEPPAHALFMLATTEIEKIPDTIISRCEVFTLEQPSRAVLAELVTSVAKKEGYSIDQETANALAIIGDGSFRDTLTHVQHVLTVTEGKKVNPDVVEKVTGVPSRATLHAILSALLQKRCDNALIEVGKAAERSVRAAVLLTELLDAVRSALVLRYAPETIETITAHYTPEDARLIQQLAAEAPSESLCNAKALSILLNNATRIASSSHQYAVLQLTLIELFDSKKA